MFRLFFASLVTFGLLISMVAGVVLGAMVALGSVNLGLAIGITIAINLVIWLVSPWLSDFTLRFFNGLVFLDDAEVRTRYPGVHRLIHEVADEYRFTAPSIGVIPDRNPTAFTYGLLRSNARIVVTQGLFEFLSEEEEARAVVAHELGHIVNRDFILMTMAGMLVQILYQVYAAMMRARGDKKGNAAIVGVAALIFYYIGIYLLLYLSRTREYLADAFSAERVEAKHLAAALVKIAYGIVKMEDTEATQTLLRSSRHLGVIDVDNAGAMGLLAESTEADPGSAAEAMLFDNYNPWAKLVEINSTHPLTGRRIAHLGAIARAKGQGIGPYDVDAAAARVSLDRGRLWSKFVRELALFVLPIMLGLVAAVLAWKFVPAAVAAGVLITLALRYPSGNPVSTTVMRLMSDPAASPVCAVPVRLEGKAIGRVDAGFIAGEDFVFQDRSGLISVDFRSMLGVLGNLFAGWRRLPKHFDRQGEVRGWFRRGMSGYVILRELNSAGGTLRAYPLFWQTFLSLIVIGANIAAVLLR